MSGTDEQPSSSRIALQKAPPLTDPYVGLTFSERYKILSKVGEGSQARVYVGRHVLIDRLVAVKILLPVLAAQKALVERFLNEGRAAGTIGHPNIVESLDMGFAPDGAPYLVLELLQGRTLSDHIENGGAFSVGRAAYVASQIASALGTAHERGIVHRDLKPDNVLLVERGGRPDHVKVLDFGISKFAALGDRLATVHGHPLGTPGFMAPEQIENPQNSDPRADVYSLGATLYNMLAGTAPFGDVGFPKILRLIAESEPQSLRELRPELPDAIVALVERAMSRDPAHRFQNMSEIEDALHQFSQEPARFRALAAGTLELGASSRPVALAAVQAPSTYGSLRPASAPVASMATLPTARKRAPRWKIAAAVLALTGAALGGFVVTRALSRSSGEAREPVASQPVAPRVHPVAGEHSVVTPAPTPSPAAPAIAASAETSQAAAPPAKAASVEKHTLRLRPRPRTGAVAAPPPNTEPAPAVKAAPASVNCEPPFYYEGKKKIFKAGCI